MTPVEEEPVLWEEEEEETADEPSSFEEFEEPESTEEDNTPEEEAMIVEALDAIKPAMARIEEFIEN
jgi:hypothetical protein